MSFDNVILFSYLKISTNYGPYIFSLMILHAKLFANYKRFIRSTNSYVGLLYNNLSQLCECQKNI